MTPSPIRIVCGADSNYASMAGVALWSVLRFDHGAPLHIHFLIDGVEDAIVRRMAAMAARRGAAFSVHDTTPMLAMQADTLMLAPHLTRTTYARLFFAELLPAAADRVIFLDVDIVCRGPLRELWQAELGEAVAAVVPDCVAGHDPVGEMAAAGRMARDWHSRRLLLPEDGTYFNSGIMLIDVARWREARVGQDALQWAADNRHLQRLADQDPVNCVLRGRVAWLDDRWNWQVAWAWREPDDDVRIIHFAGPDKPWQPHYRGVGGAAWRDVAAASPFPEAWPGRPARSLRSRLAARLAGRRPPGGDIRRLRLRPVADATVEQSGGVEVIANDPAGSDVFANGPYVTVPPGAYAAELRLALLEAPDGARQTVRVYVGMLRGTRTPAMLEFPIPAGAVLRDMPVTVDFVLPGPVHDLEFWVQASPGLRVKLRSEVVLRRRRDGWRTAFYG